MYYATEHPCSRWELVGCPVEVEVEADDGTQGTDDTQLTGVHYEVYGWPFAVA